MSLCCCDSSCRLKITGDMIVSFPSGIIQTLRNNPWSTALSLHVKDASHVDEILMNKQLISEYIALSSLFNRLIFCRSSNFISAAHIAVITITAPSNRQRLSSDACLEDKREDNQNCSVLCCVQQLCTMICTHTREQLLHFYVS